MEAQPSSRAASSFLVCLFWPDLSCTASRFPRGALSRLSTRTRGASSYVQRSARRSEAQIHSPSRTSRDAERFPDRMVRSTLASLTANLPGPLKCWPGGRVRPSPGMHTPTLPPTSTHLHPHSTHGVPAHALISCAVVGPKQGANRAPCVIRAHNVWLPVRPHPLHCSFGPLKNIANTPNTYTRTAPLP